MLKTLKYSALALALGLGSSTLAMAHDDHDRGHRDPNPPCDPNQPSGNVAPEIDPSLAFGSLSLLGGTLMVMRTRRRTAK